MLLVASSLLGMLQPRVISKITQIPLVSASMIDLSQTLAKFLLNLLASSNITDMFRVPSCYGDQITIGSQLSWMSSIKGKFYS